MVEARVERENGLVVKVKLAFRDTPNKGEFISIMGKSWEIVRIEHRARGFFGFGRSADIVVVVK